ncbi:hypothetical protein [Komagataeibacter oboediens]|nr:hypothetical protein [Komagataeibacter oboediens]
MMRSFPQKTLEQQMISITLSVNFLMRPDHYRDFDRQGSITGKMAAETGVTGACP